MKMKISLMVLISGFVCIVQAQVKIGIIGLDTSHSINFTKFLNGENKKTEYKEFKITTAYPYGSTTIKSSYERIPGYIEQVQALGVEIVPSISELLSKVDCVLLETNDGNLHLEQAHEVFKAGKIMFIDKPIGATLAQAIAIYQLARRYNVPIFSSSALRFVEQLQKISNGEFGEVVGADSYSPHHKEKSHPDFGWYGIHGVEMLYTAMGTGCISVNRMSSEKSDVVIGLWNKARIGTFRGMQQEEAVYGGTVFTKDGAITMGKYEGYEKLMDEIVKFFETGIPPVTEEETIEIFTFMEASNESKRQGGKIILMEDTYRKGLKEAQQLLQELK